MKYLLLTLGGTIDGAAYPEKLEDYPAKSVQIMEEPRARDVLRTLLPPTAAMEWTPICAKDSKDLDAADRQRLADAITVAGGYARVIVTMGTDTMCEVAQGLAARGLALACPVVFTGAIWPLANAARSDGPENLRLALSGDLAPGVYIAMSGVLAGAERVRKDFVGKRFVRVE